MSKQLNKEQMIDLMMLGQYLANSGDFAMYMVELARKRIEEDKYDTQFMEVREVTCKLARLVHSSTAQNFDIETAYYLCKQFKEKVVFRWGTVILDYGFIKKPELAQKLRHYLQLEVQSRLNAVPTY